MKEQEKNPKRKELNKMDGKTGRRAPPDTTFSKRDREK